MKIVQNRVSIWLSVTFILLTVSTIDAQSGLIDIDVQVVHPTFCDSLNGEIHIRPLNGTPPYQYSIDGGSDYQSDSIFTHLSGGTYILSIKDAQQFLSSFTLVKLSPPGAPVINSLVLTNPVRCGEGGRIKIIATGDTMPLQYSINGGLDFQESPVFSEVIAGSYDIRVQNADSSCWVGYPTVPFVPQEPDFFLNFLPQTTAPDCDVLNGRIELNITGGSGDYLVKMDGGAYQSASFFNDLGAGNYIFTVFDTVSNCEKTFPPVLLESVNCNTDTLLIDTSIVVGDSDTICFSDLFPGTSINSILPTCEGASPAVGFELNNIDQCLIYEGLQIGKDSLCLEICREDDQCTELIIIVNVTDRECSALFSQPHLSLTASDCDDLAKLCLNKQKEDLLAYELYVNGELYGDAFDDCDVPEEAALELSVGIHELVFLHKNGLCNDTLAVSVICDPENNEIRDTLLVNETDYFLYRYHLLYRRTAIH